MHKDNSEENRQLYWNGETPSFVDNEFDSEVLHFLQVLSSKPAITLLAIALADKNKMISEGISDTLKLLGSQMLNSSTNLLVGEINNEIFVVSQHVSSCDFIFFPRLNKVKIICHANMEMVVDIASKLEDLAGKLEFNIPPSFDGLIASHGRPSHYFYDAILGLSEVNDYLNSIPQGKKLSLYQISHCNFADLKFFVGDKFHFPQSSVHFDQLNSLSNSANKLFLKVGSFYDRGNEVKRLKLLKYDELFLSESLRNKGNDYREVQELKKAGYFILWHGITTQKRKWLEQCDAIVALATMLYNSGEKLCVIIDGWTSPITPSKLDESQIESDNVVFSEIKNNIPPDIRVINAIGKTPAEKLTIASLCNFHVSNGGTGSIYTSRMAKIPGILHISNKAIGMTEQSIHYNSAFVPDSFVHDIEVEGLRDDFVSYSIAKKPFVSFALEKIAELFDIKVVPIDIGYSINCKHLTNSEEYESTSDDPILVFNKSSVFSNYEGNVEVKVRVNTLLNYKSLTPKLYLDLGNGYSEELSLLSKYNSNGEVTFSLNVTKELKSLRFDPFSCKGKFNIEYALLKLF
ncbi:hypothetical protein AWH61_17435 [Alteromonas sp. W12]|uniref:hypothetical protein n=1 Tax=Alteromonas sp. W12 TaxID=1772289 RepID=UPI0009491898|nr:hypothetical protein [Alteromonas sp. W12]OLF71921.1 hypothetical protein AWH61_17435 [Alteromonas sp. W12]